MAAPSNGRLNCCCAGDVDAPADCACGENARVLWTPPAKHRDDLPVAGFMRHLKRLHGVTFGEGLRSFSTDGVRLTYGQVRLLVVERARALRAHLGADVATNDEQRRPAVVAGYLPNGAEAALCALAAAAVGAVWAGCSPDFGPQAVVERMGQVRPRVLFSVLAVRYNGKRHSHVHKLAQVIRALPSLELCVIVPFLDDRQESVDDLNPPGSVKCITLDTFLQLGEPVSGQKEEFEYAQVSPHHPLYVMFSSGTTGAPKCMVHTGLGTLLKHTEEHSLQHGVTPDDVLVFWTTTGWMMWNWLLGAMQIGATIVLYDGSPFEPKSDAMFDLIDQLGVTIFGAGAKCYAVFEEKQLTPRETHSLSSLRMVLSTGSVLAPDNFDYIHNSVKDSIPIGSISGGTDIIGCFVGGSEMVPCVSGQCQCLFLGMDVKCLNEKGDPVFDQRGELVCTKPFPSMPGYFLNDSNGEKYRKAYFDRFPGVWAHGDFCMIDSQTGGVIMLGRSDATLNPGGVRFGSAEIYRVVESLPEVEDSVCVAQRKQPDNSRERVVLFVKLKDGQSSQLDVHKIKTVIRQKLSPKHVPECVLQVEDIPYTANGKKVELAVRDVIEGRPPGNEHALRNPQALDQFAQMPQLNQW